jgi:hypothetical protein
MGRRSIVARPADIDTAILGKGRGSMAVQQIKSDKVTVVPILVRDEAGDIVPASLGDQFSVQSSDPAKLEATIIDYQGRASVKLVPLAETGSGLSYTVTDHGGLQAFTEQVDIVEDTSPRAIGLDLANAIELPANTSTDSLAGKPQDGSDKNAGADAAKSDAASSASAGGASSADKPSDTGSAGSAGAGSDTGGQGGTSSSAAAVAGPAATGSGAGADAGPAVVEPGSTTAAMAEHQETLGAAASSDAVASTAAPDRSTGAQSVDATGTATDAEATQRADEDKHSETRDAAAGSGEPVV